MYILSFHSLSLSKHKSRIHTGKKAHALDYHCHKMNGTYMFHSISGFLMLTSIYYLSEFLLNSFIAVNWIKFVNCGVLPTGIG